MNGKMPDTPPFRGSTSAWRAGGRCQIPDRGMYPVGARPRGAAERVLISGVDEHLVYVLKSELEDDGYAVDVVPPGAAGADNALDPDHGIIILGMPIPCLDYFNRLRTIRRDRPAAYLVVFSDNAPEQDKPLLTTAGADAFFAGHEIDLLKARLRRRHGPERRPSI